MPKEMPKTYKEKLQWYKNLKEEQEKIEKEIRRFDYYLAERRMRKISEWVDLQPEVQILKAKELEEDLELEKLEKEEQECLEREREQRKLESQPGYWEKKHAVDRQWYLEQQEGARVYKQQTGRDYWEDHDL